MRQRSLRADVALAAEELVAVRREVVVEVLCLRRRLRDERAGQGPERLGLAGMHLEVGLDGDGVRREAHRRKETAAHPGKSTGQRSGGAIRSGGPHWRGWEEINLESRKTGTEPIKLRFSCFPVFQILSPVGSLCRAGASRCRLHGPSFLIAPEVGHRPSGRPAGSALTRRRAQDRSSTPSHHIQRQTKNTTTPPPIAKNPENLQRRRLCQSGLEISQRRQDGQSDDDAGTRSLHWGHRGRVKRSMSWRVRVRPFRNRVSGPSSAGQEANPLRRTSGASPPRDRHPPRPPRIRPRRK